MEVTTGGQVHKIDVRVDRIAQEPHLEHTTSPDGLVKNGTFVKMYWDGIAGYLSSDKGPYFYKMDAFDLIAAYVKFNPHAQFGFVKTGENIECEDRPTNPSWCKWTPDDSTSPHWYTYDKLRGLIAAYVGSEQYGERALTVREFVSQFRGLSSTAKQKAVVDSLGLSGAYLHDLVDGGDIDRQQAELLLDAMCSESREVKPDLLGIIGEEHFRQDLLGFCDAHTIKYKLVKGMAGSLPYVLEVAFGVHNHEYQDCRGDRVVGLNWSPALRMPMEELEQALAEMRVDWFDPVDVVVHLACPRLEFTDRGKSRLSLPKEIVEALNKAIKYVAKDWKAAKRKADRNDRVRDRELEELRKEQKRLTWSIKEAAEYAMEEAYMQASANGTLPANARQIMYAARPLVLDKTGGKCWKNSSYFTQHILPEYMDNHPTDTANWDVVFDARGKLVEPHTETRVDLGGLAVRRYVAGWHDEIGDEITEFHLAHRVDTAGPANRYKYALFVEKRGSTNYLRMCVWQIVMTWR